MRIPLALSLAAALLAVVPAAEAKTFGPGDVRVCGADRCLPVTRRAALDGLFWTIYAGPRPAVARPVRLGGPTFELRYRNDYVTGLAGGARFDRFLSHGVHLGHFARGRWHRLDPRAAAEIRRLAKKLKPIPLTRAAVAASR